MRQDQIWTLDTDKVPAAWTPEVGEHNDAIPRAAGYSDSGITRCALPEQLPAIERRSQLDE
jgi:hypothetical protein